ncbi:MAG: MerR family transcriptional regulator [Cyclobacteriaceae bacterium]
MGRYSIKELEKLSGIKAHTIRIWEKRHRLVEPQRTATNIRFYSDDDLKKIINVSLLNNNGVKISKIADMTEDELSESIVQLSDTQNPTNLYIDQLIIAMIDMEEEQFEKLVSHLIMKFGFEKTILEIVYPFLEKIGVLWQTGNITPAQEHFITNLIRQKIIVAIDSLPFAKPDAKRAVLFLPENELHDIGLLFYHYVVKKMGFKTYYLGQHLPYQDLFQVCQIHKPEVIITSLIVSTKKEKTSNYLKSILKDFPQIKVLASGALLTKISIEAPNFHVFSNVASLRANL